MSLDDQGYVNLDKLSQRNYGRIFLTRNPFPALADPEEIPVTTVDREGILRRFTDVLAHLYTNQSSAVSVILGDYGSGKSHLLKLFKASVNRKLLTTKDPSVAAYVKSPGRSIRDLWLYLVEDLGRGFLTDLSRKSIFEFLRKDPKKYLPVGTELELSDYGDVPDYLDKGMALDLIGDMASGSFESVRYKDLVNAFLLLSHPTLSAPAWRWFTGSSLSKDERKKIMVRGEIDDSSTSESALNGLIRLLHGLNFTGLILLVDELETLTLIRGLGKGLYQDSLRHMMDDNPSGLIAFFAVTPAEWADLTQTPSGLVRRLAGSVFDLAPFTADQVTDLVRQYLRISRIDTYEEKLRDLREITKGLNKETYPFTNASLDTILSLTDGIVSKVVLLCHFCIDNFVQGTDPLITPNFVKTVASREGFG